PLYRFLQGRRQRNKGCPDDRFRPRIVKPESDEPPAIHDCVSGSFLQTLNFLPILVLAGEQSLETADCQANRVDRTHQSELSLLRNLDRLERIAILRQQ